MHENLPSAKHVRVAIFLLRKTLQGLVMVSTGPTRSGGPWLWADRSEAETVKRSFTYPRQKIKSGLVMVSTGYVKLEKRVVWRCVKWPN